MGEEKSKIIFAGTAVGLISVLLVRLGNPANMGFCIACFLRDAAGALGLHQAAVVQYFRPEIIGLVLGAFIMSVGRKEFAAKGGSSPLTRFILGIVVMIGALIFLGCPLRMMLRLGGGDLNALVGLAGFIFGISLGIFSLNKGFTLKRNYKMPQFEGYLFPAVNLGLFALFLAAPALFIFSETGPGAAAAPVFISLAAGLIVGALAQRTRLCMVGGTRDLILFRDNYLFLGFITIILSSAVLNWAFGYFELGFLNQPIAHTDGLWNFLGLALVGWGSVLLGGCPLRQLILAGEGNTDSAVTILGLIFGAALAHNFGLASSAAGPTVNGKVAAVISFLFLGLLSYLNAHDFRGKEA